MAKNKKKPASEYSPWVGVTEVLIGLAIFIVLGILFINSGKIF